MTALVSPFEHTVSVMGYSHCLSGTTMQHKHIDREGHIVVCYVRKFHSFVVVRNKGRRLNCTLTVHCIDEHFFVDCTQNVVCTIVVGQICCAAGGCASSPTIIFYLYLFYQQHTASTVEGMHTSLVKDKLFSASYSSQVLTSSVAAPLKSIKCRAHLTKTCVHGK